MLRRLFGKRISSKKLKAHINDPIWIDKNWDYIIKSFGPSDYFINHYWSKPSIAIMEVFKKHNVNFQRFIYISCIYDRSIMSFEILKWLVDNKIINGSNSYYSYLCVSLLDNPDEESFKKFEYLYDNGFPLENKDLFSKQPTIKISNTKFAIKLFARFGNDKIIYSVGSEIYKNLEKFYEYMILAEIFNIKDPLSGSIELCVKYLGIPAMNIMEKFGLMTDILIHIHYLNEIETKFITENQNYEKEKWLIDHDFRKLSFTNGKEVTFIKIKSQ